jgi:hypothetical protein
MKTDHVSHIGSAPFARHVRISLLRVIVRARTHTDTDTTNAVCQLQACSFGPAQTAAVLKKIVRHATCYRRRIYHSTVSGTKEQKWR